jgi:DNA repair photolyase
MLGCDTEFFQSKENSLEILKKLTDANRDISVITKLALPPKFIEELSLIRSELEDRGNLFSFSVSIPCFESANFWEPKAPRPEKRIETLESAFANGFKTLVALRPLLPTVADPELAHIISSTKDISHGYYSGPLYLKNLDESLISYEALGKLNVEKLQPHWMPAGNDFYKIERPRQMEYLNSIVNQSGKRLFEGAADAIQFLKNEKY